jgi:thiamine-phosphate pyrophosphorylase
VTASADRRPFLAGRRLYLCTGDREDLEGFLEACISGGVDVVQLRDKHLDDAGIVARASLAQRVCAARDVPFILNDRPDLAADIGADGVHVGQDDLSATEARQIVGAERIVGLSTHDPRQLEEALRQPVDYISAGPIVPTPTKPGRPGTGLTYVTQAARMTAGHRPPLPFFVTGNARPDTVEAMVAAGARRVVVVRWLTESDDPETAARQLASSLDTAIAATGG